MTLAAVRRFVIIGAGGQAREVDWTLRTLGHTVVGYVITDTTRTSPFDSTEKVLGDCSWLDANRGAFDALALGIGSPRARLAVAQGLSERFTTAYWPPVVHPTATYDEESCVLGRGIFISAGAILTVGVTLSDFAMANFGATIGHEASIGSGSVLNPGCNVSGGVRIGDAVLVGTGAQVLQYLSIGDAAIVGAGAVVVKDVASGETVKGVPASSLQVRS